MNVWLWWVQQFQTTIVGFVGFAGVIITLVANARIVSNGRNAALRHERQTLRTALSEELRVLRAMYQNNAQKCAESKRDNPNPSPTAAFKVPLFSLTAFYDASINKLGLLSNEQVANVMNAYLRHKQLQVSIVDHLAVQPPQIAERSVTVSLSHREVLQGMCEAMLPDIDAALTALSKEVAP
jgi:hypothetical protein